jgi:hypothetical protein
MRPAGQTGRRTYDPKVAYTPHERVEDYDQVYMNHDHHESSAFQQYIYIYCATSFC